MTQTARLPDHARLGGVHLQVADLDSSVAWYRDGIGAQVLRQKGHVASLGAHGDPTALLTLHGHPGASPMPSRGRLGLFHVAWLLPDRASLGRLISHVAARGEHVGSADHLVSEALYLQDPDGLGVEVYADRPRSSWNVSRGQVEMASLPLDVAGLVRAGGSVTHDGLPRGTTIGHVHLHVGDLEASTAFYRDVIGFDVTQSAYPGARFLSAGGYHHHLGTNTWAGANALPPAAGDAQLLRWDLVLSSHDEREQVTRRAQAAGVELRAEDDGSISLADPWGTRVHLVVLAR